MPTSKTRVPTNSLAGGLLVAGLLIRDWKIVVWAEQNVPTQTKDPARTMTEVSFKETPAFGLQVVVIFGEEQRGEVYP